MKNYISILLCFMACNIGQAQWQSINPGAGGQVQDIACDPNTENRLILSSDMEGIYESLDNGDSWHIKGSLHHNRVFCAAFAPNDKNKLYVGTLYSLEVSNDGGNTFTLIENTKKKSVSAIAVNPKNTNIVIAGIGWKDDYDFTDIFELEQNAKGEIYRSTDAGKTWTLINFDQDENSDRNVFTIQFDPNNSDIVYLGAGKGIFKSLDAGLTWTKIKAPNNTKRHQGLYLSPDGKVIYATYLKNDRNGSIYASSTSNIQWEEVIYGNGDIILGEYNFWYPEVDSRSTGDEHKLVVGLIGDREGLFEGTFNWENGSLREYGWETIWRGKKGYDNGWDNAPTNPRFAHYTPSDWDRAIWSTTNQTMFLGVPNKDGSYAWLNKYSIPHTEITVSQWGKENPTYTNRGTESTYTYDIAVHDNYIVQGQGDNGAVESWDYGATWSNAQHRTFSPPLSDVQAVDIAFVDEIPVVVAQMTSGYGGGALNGNLYYKKLMTHSPKDRWKFLAGGFGEVGGLPSGVLRDVAVSPAKTNRVFMYATEGGLYMIDAINQAIKDVESGKEPTVVKISNGVADGIHAVKKIAPHPTNPDIVFINGTRGDKEGVYKGVKNGDNWEWSKIYDGSNWDSEVVTWEHNGQVYVFFSGASAEKGGDGSEFIGALSLDEGKTWKTVITKKTAQKLRSNDWYEAISDIYQFHNKGGAAGYENHIIMSYYDHRMQKAYGIFKGTINKKGKVTWKDWTGDLHFGGLTSTIIKEEKGVPYVYISTPGAGAWKRPFSDK
jgi:photosystem II stability/assembly factor-like uncharacterized protein